MLDGVGDDSLNASVQARQHAAEEERREGKEGWGELYFFPPFRRFSDQSKSKFLRWLFSIFPMFCLMFKHFDRGFHQFFSFLFLVVAKTKNKNSELKSKKKN